MPALLLTIPEILKWIGLFQQIHTAGGSAWADVKAALANHGIEADTAALDAVIADADARAARRRGDAAEP